MKFILFGIKVLFCRSGKWGREERLLLIEQYKGFPELWNPSHPNYYNRDGKKDIWNEIAHNVKCPVLEVRQKMDSILACYRRVRSKARANKDNGIVF